MNANFTCAGEGSGLGNGAIVPYGCYQVLENLRLKFTDIAGGTAARNYRRELDVATAIARVRYELEDAQFTREVVPSPDRDTSGDDRSV